VDAKEGAGPKPRPLVELAGWSAVCVSVDGREDHNSGVGL
jgi:hypothetical protein